MSNYLAELCQYRTPQQYGVIRTGTYFYISTAIYTTRHTAVCFAPRSTSSTRCPVSLFAGSMHASFAVADCSRHLAAHSCERRHGRRMELAIVLQIIAVSVAPQQRGKQTNTSCWFKQTIFRLLKINTNQVFKKLLYSYCLLQVLVRMDYSGRPLQHSSFGLKQQQAGYVCVT